MGAFFTASFFSFAIETTLRRSAGISKSGNESFINGVSLQNAA
jgi:hypothetical protein